MSTYDHLELAEKELRNALRSTTDTTKAYQLRRIVDMINTIEDIKRFFKNQDINTTSEFNFDVVIRRSAVCTKLDSLATISYRTCINTYRWQNSTVHTEL